MKLSLKTSSYNAQKSLIETGLYLPQILRAGMIYQHLSFQSEVP